VSVCGELARASSRGLERVVGTTDAGSDRPTIAHLLRAAGARFGREEYLVTPDTRLSFAEVEARSALRARWLLTHGVGKGTRVGLFFPNGAEYAAWWLAITRIGAVAVPLSTLYTPAEVGTVLRLADVHLLLAPARVLSIDVASHLEAALPGLPDQSPGGILLPQVPYLRRIVITDPGDRAWASGWTADDPALAPPGLLQAAEAEVFPSDLAVMVHTSGTTAEPKGVLHTHGTLVRQTSTWPSVTSTLAGITARPRVFCAVPFFWIGGILALVGALQGPATVLTLPRLEAVAALDLIEAAAANAVVGWPAFTQKMRLHASFGDRDLSHIPMLREAPADIAMIGVPDGYPIHRSMTETAGSFAFTQTRIVDPEDRDVDDGTVGELLIRGAGVMAGYNKRERTEVFDADGWYHTGDQVYRRSGDPRLFYVGRTTELIKTAGANVSPREVEAVLEEIPGVAHCVVLGIEHPERGQDVCAVVVLAEGVTDTGPLRAAARERLSAYKVPSRWVVASDLPTLASGKPDRGRIAAMLCGGDLAALR
jgi:acyl-CoA synthetase (AMP-forming)/AMP-acid ligase II